MSSRLWPIGETAQADYEALREAVLLDQTVDSLAGARFARRGPAGLIAWPVSEPLYTAIVRGASRPAWTPYADPRLDALAAGYELLLGALSEVTDLKRAQR